MSQILKNPNEKEGFLRCVTERWLFWFANGLENHGVFFKCDIDSHKRREWKMATGTQMVLGVKKNN